MLNRRFMERVTQQQQLRFNDFMHSCSSFIADAYISCYDTFDENHFNRIFIIIRDYCFTLFYKNKCITISDTISHEIIKTDMLKLYDEVQVRVLRQLEKKSVFDKISLFQKNTLLSDKFQRVIRLNTNHGFKKTIEEILELNLVGSIYIK